MAEESKSRRINILMEIGDERERGGRESERQSTKVDELVRYYSALFFKIAIKPQEQVQK